MNCEEFRANLDAYVDGALNEQGIDAMLEHTKICNACARELAAAKALRDALRDMDASVAVPLETQAAWRDAVRREAGKRQLRKKLRAVYAAAAALIVLAGCAAVFRGGLFAQKEARVSVQPMAVEEVDASAIIAADGLTANASEKPDYTARRRLSTRDMRSADTTVRTLCAEYGAEIVSETDSETDGREARTYRIELSCDYMEDFLRAVTQIGDVLESEIREVQAEPAVIELQICG